MPDGEPAFRVALVGDERFWNFGTGFFAVQSMAKDSLLHVLVPQLKLHQLIRALPGERRIRGSWKSALLVQQR